jgi:hypothetical protein
LTPRGSRHCCLRFGGHPTGRLSYYLNSPDDRKKEHPVDVKVAAILSGYELPHRLCGVNHMQDAEPIVIADIGLERSESLLL